MSYDLLIKNGRIIDGSGRPAFHGDVGVERGKIVELGRLDGAARRTIEADGRVVAPGSSGILSAPSPVITARPP
jgi:N-acyl-D-amino-acid deacylase